VLKRQGIVTDKSGHFLQIHVGPVEPCLSRRGGIEPVWFVYFGEAISPLSFFGTAIVGLVR
jgi:hypothetical protein